MDVKIVKTNLQGKIYQPSNKIVHNGCDGHYNQWVLKDYLVSYGEVHKDDIAIITNTTHSKQGKH